MGSYLVSLLLYIILPKSRFYAQFAMLETNIYMNLVEKNIKIISLSFPKRATETHSLIHVNITDIIPVNLKLIKH